MRNFNTKYVRKQRNENGGLEIVFEACSYQDEQIIEELEKDVLYRLDVAQIKSKRSIQQNKYLWNVIHEISLAENGKKATSDDDWDIYIQCLEQANAKCEIIAVRKEAVAMLKETFRAIKELGTFTSTNGWEMVQLKCFYGSSKMDVTEMGKLLDVVIERAYQNDIELVPYE